MKLTCISLSFLAVSSIVDGKVDILRGFMLQGMASLIWVRIRGEGGSCQNEDRPGNKANSNSVVTNNFGYKTSVKHNCVTFGK